MKRKILAIVLVVVIALSVVAWLYQSQVNNVKITAFRWLPGFSTTLGFANVTVQNMGINVVSDLTLTVQLFRNSTGTEIVQPYTASIDTLKVGESREISVFIQNEGEDLYNADGKLDAVCVVTLTLGGQVLDEWKHVF
jgi:hypothetical protein